MKNHARSSLVVVALPVVVVLTLGAAAPRGASAQNQCNREWDVTYETIGLHVSGTVGVPGGSASGSQSETVTLVGEALPEGMFDGAVAGWSAALDALPLGEAQREEALAAVDALYADLEDGINGFVGCLPDTVRMYRYRAQSFWEAVFGIIPVRVVYTNAACGLDVTVTTGTDAQCNFWVGGFNQADGAFGDTWFGAVLSPWHYTGTGFYGNGTYGVDVALFGFVQDAIAVAFNLGLHGTLSLED
jgi:hypothetical protein